MPDSATTIEVGGHDLRVSNREKVFFPEAGLTKGDLIDYYLAVGEEALVGCRDRPCILKRFPHGAHGEHFFQKRAPESHPPFIRTAEVRFPSGRRADFLVIDSVAALIWSINLGCIDINPWPVRSGDVDHPDELRVDLDPGPGVPFEHVRQVAMTVRDVLADHGMRGYPKTSGSRGIHINVRIEPRWEFGDVRRAALALGREVERRVPEISTTKWWKEERHGVFIDYNQNARDRTVASVYSVRPMPDARVSCALEWDEVPNVEPAELTLRTVPDRVRDKGDPGAGIDSEAFSLEPLLQMAERDAVQGLGDAPWPPHFAKGEDEPARVAPSRARKPKS